VGACEAGCGVNRPGADNAALSGFIDGAGVGSLDIGGNGLVDWEVETETINCSPFVIGIEDNKPVANKGLGG
jgi:hypothetical protein